MNYFNWQSEKPTFTKECIIICASKFNNKDWSFNIYQIKMVENDGNSYLGWLTGDGDEYGSLEDMHAEKYLLLPL